MTKHELNLRTKRLALEIHRGFLDKSLADTLSDEEILTNIPSDGLTFKRLNDFSGIMVLKPFTIKQIRKAIKLRPTVTSYDILVAAGFCPAQE